MKSASVEQAERAKGSLRRTTRSPASKPRSKGTSTPDPLQKASTRVRLVGGKGGVGKTTCAAALALSAAREGHRTLLLSVDPASSLGDALQMPLGRSPRPVPIPRGTLHAAEIHAATTIQKWLAPRSAVLEEIALHGTWLDRDDVSGLLRQSLPGIDELAALLELARFGRSRRYDLIVLDTAPTGHTLRMLSLPETFGVMARVFDTMQAKHRALVSAIRGSWTTDAADALIDELEAASAGLRALLSDRERAQVTWVSLPEPMASEETLDGVRSLAALGMEVETVVINRVTPAPRTPCSWCTKRRALERKALGRLRSGLRSLSTQHRPRFVSVEERDPEPVGIRALDRIAIEIASARRAATPPRARRITTPPPPVGKSLAKCGAFDNGPVRLLMLGGKGGVGKTTCAAAIALAAARASSRRVLLLSTDPAHSLSDVLDASCSDVPAPIPGGDPNLHVRELDASKAFRAVRDRYSSAIDALFDRVSRGSPFDAGHDRRVMHSLLDLAPPGIDELMALLDVTESLAGGRYDLIVIDTAPTGHALRLLEMPQVVHEWIKSLMRIVLKYQPVVGAQGLAQTLVRVSKEIRCLRALIADGEATRFLVVTRGAALPRTETVRLCRRLAGLGVRVSEAIVNAVGRGTCARCRRIAGAEQREITTLVREVTTVAPGLRIAHAPAEMPPPHGARRLLRWQKRWECE